jgi:hypothetical protein
MSSRARPPPPGQAPRGEGIGPPAYAMNAAALSEVSNGAEWNPDPSFSVAEAILDDPAFASVLRAVLSDGHVVVPAAEAKGK